MPSTRISWNSIGKKKTLSFDFKAWLRLFLNVDSDSRKQCIRFFPKSKFEGVETSTPSITFSWILAEVKINGLRLDLIFLPFSCFHSSLKNARTSRLIWIRFHKSTNPQHKMTQLISSDMFWIRLMLFWSPLAHSLSVSLSLSHHFLILLYRAHFWKILWKIRWPCWLVFAAFLSC